MIEKNYNNQDIFMREFKNDIYKIGCTSSVRAVSNWQTKLVFMDRRDNKNHV